MMVPFLLGGEIPEGVAENSCFTPDQCLEVVMGWIKTLKLNPDFTEFLSGW